METSAQRVPQDAPQEAATKREEKKNGFIEYQFNDEGVFIVIHMPTGGGKPLSLEELKTELAKRGFANIVKDETALRAIYRTRETPFKISGPLFDVEKKDGAFTLEVSRDGMEARLRVMPAWGGKAVTPDEIQAEIKNKEIAFGVDEEALNAALRETREDSEYIVAKGIPAVAGSDGDIMYLFERELKAVPKELEDGRVDYRELNLIVNVTKGTVLAEKIPATEGTSGRNIFGKEIPAKRGRELPLPAGKGVVRSEDGMKLIAETDGCPVVAGKQLKVLPVYEIKGDVDFTTGNIYFMGNVIVRGSIKSGFKVVASGNVEIYQGIEDARVEAEGKILVKRGIAGQGKAIVKAGDEIMSKFIQNAEVRTKESIQTEACFHSTVLAGKKITVGGKRGLIVGGLVRAGLEVNAKTVGSPYATPTEIQVGIDPQLREASLNLNAQINADTENLAGVEKGLKHIGYTTQQAGEISGYKANLYQRLRQTKLQLEERLAELKEKLDKIKEQIGNESTGILRVKDVLHPGVRISLRHTSRIMTDAKKAISLYESEGEMKEGAA